jgi:hypothetical protein
MTEKEVVSLEKYLETRLEDQRVFFDSRIDAIEKATCEATLSLNKRLEGMNEFRAALKDQNSTFLPRNEYEVQHEKLENDIKVLRESKAMLEGKASQQSVNFSTLIAIAGVLIGIIALIVHLGN